MVRPINAAGLELIKSFEKCVLTVYADQGGKPTVGWGHLVVDDDDLDLGDTITQEDADNMLLDDLSDAYEAIAKDVTVDLTDNQYGALVSLVFNAGASPLQGGVGRKLAAKDYPGAASQFLLWVHVRSPDGVEIVSLGLVNRRKAEVALFLKA
jgi:lysozyme